MTSSAGGESAGGAAVDALLCSKTPMPQLFHRAIAMSSNTIVEQRFLNKPNGALHSMEDLGVEFQKRLNVLDDPNVRTTLLNRFAAAGVLVFDTPRA